MFLTTSLSTTLLNFFKTMVAFFNLITSKSSIFVSKLFKIVGTLVSLLMLNLLTSAFKAIKYILGVKSDVSTSVACSNSFLVA